MISKRVKQQIEYVRFCAEEIAGILDCGGRVWDYVVTNSIQDDFLDRCSKLGITPDSEGAYTLDAYAKGFIVDHLPPIVTRFAEQVEKDFRHLSRCRSSLNSDHMDMMVEIAISIVFYELNHSAIDNFYCIPIISY